ITTNNEIYVWGHNVYGQLGLGHNQNQNSPQKLNFPAGEEKVRNAPFSNLAGKSGAFSSPVNKIICGCRHSIAITGEEKVRNAPFSNPLGKMREHFSSTVNNEVYVWGRNASGQLGLGHNQNQNYP